MNDSYHPKPSKLPPNQQKDQIYASRLDQVDDFKFDATVADVFADMIERSVPGYSKIIQMIEIIAQHQAHETGLYYDLGCSLGASTLAMRRGVAKGLLGKSYSDSTIIGIDNSLAMVERCQGFMDRDPTPIKVDIQHKDIEDASVYNANMVTLNFTLQFIQIAKRLPLLTRILEGMNPGGVLVLSEKVQFDDPQQQLTLEELHYDFKSANGYSDMEISQKRAALEKVLIPETIQDHRQRLKTAGFSRSEVWFQCFNFISLIAYK